MGLKDSLQFKIDPNTLEVTFIDFKLPADVVGLKFLLQIDFSRDGRDPKYPSTYF